MRYGFVMPVSLLLFTQIAFAQSPPDVLTYSWQDIEQVLERHVPATPAHVFDDLYMDPVLRDLTDTKDPNLYWEMVAQSKYPFVQMAGLQLLQSQSADSAVDAAVYLILSPDFPLMMAAVVTQRLSNDHDADLIISRLATYGRAEPLSPKRWGILISNLPTDRLKKWYESAENKSLPLSYESVILDGIISGDVDKTNLTVRETRDLESFRLAPGLPRSVYVLHANERDDGFADATRAVLQDQTLPEIVKVLVAMRRKSFILHTLKWKEMGLPKQVVAALEAPAAQP